MTFSFFIFLNLFYSYHILKIVFFDGFYPFLSFSNNDDNNFNKNSFFNKF